MERKEKRREAVKVENLKKSYGDRQVLKGVSFQVSRGEIFGVLGVNGAGKTTLLECLEGFRRYEEGKYGSGNLRRASCRTPPCRPIYGRRRP